MLRVLIVLVFFTAHSYGQNCTFDDATDPLCSYTMRFGNDNFGWMLNRGSTPTENTGPDADHSENGQYIYASAVVDGTDNARVRGRKARVISPNITTSEKGKLLRFYYYMYGRGVGVLNVYILDDGMVKLPRSIWRRTGNRGQRWRLGEVVLPKNSDFRIVFESVVGRGKLGDIAIDDITIEDLAWSCNFEKDTCNFHQYDGDEFDWWTNSGKTSTKGTGPPIDHTKETSRGTYMYIESTDQESHDRAILISRPFTKDPDRYCGLSFFYHMMGVNIGILKLHILYDNNTGFDQAVWSDTISYGNIWMENVAYLNNISGLFQFAFEGVRGSGGHKGDIGIDDVKLLGDGCSVFPNDIVPGNCSANPCQNDGSCIEMVGGVVCNCTIGKSGKLCETVNLCAFDPCHNGGTCQTVGPIGFACRCPIGWSGPTCTLSTLASTVSSQKATTVTPTTTSDITSTRVTTGRLSSQPSEIAESSSYVASQSPANSAIPHSQLAQTTEYISRRTLSPTTSSIPPSPVVTQQSVTLITTGIDATGEDVDVTDSSELATTESTTNYNCSALPCIQGDCFNVDNGYRCQCYPSWKGDKCDQDVNECSTELLNKCANNGTCTNTVGSYTCTCADGWMGENCEQECEDENNSCDYWAGTKECTINPSYMLKYCQYSCGVCKPYECVDRHENCPLWAGIGECSKNPFYMLGMCHRSCGVCIDDECSTYPCKNGGVCTDLEDDYSCACAPGWGGVNCHVPLNECNSNPCQNNGSCLDSVAYYQCVCTDGYEGVHCENETDHCYDEPCLNGGVCVDIGLDFSCTCADGFYGKSCENDTNECLSNPCEHGGTCSDKAGSYECECPDEWTGENCQHDFNECQSNPCRNEGSCFHGIGHRFYLCRCLNGYEGDNCEDETDECQSSPCNAGSTCLDLEGRYECLCEPGWTGSMCRLDINECASDPCQNKGGCLDLINSYVCLCQVTYSGTNCETRVSKCAKYPCVNGGVCNESSKYIKSLCHCPPQWGGIYCEIANFVPTTPAPTTAPITTVPKLTTNNIRLTTEGPEISGDGSIVSTPSIGSTRSKFVPSKTAPSTPIPSTQKSSTPKFSTRKPLTPKLSTRKPLTPKPPTKKPEIPEQPTPIPLTPVPSKSTVKPSITTTVPTKRMRTTTDNRYRTDAGNDIVSDLPEVDTNRSPKKNETSLFLIIAIAAGTFALAVIIIILIGVKVCRRNTGGRYEQFPLDSTAGGTMTWASEASGGSLSYQKFMDSEPTLNDASSYRENSSL